MKKLNLLSVSGFAFCAAGALGSAVTANAGKYFDRTPENYPGFICDLSVGGISGSVRNTLELKRNGNLYQGREPRFDLVSTSYKKGVVVKTVKIVGGLVISRTDDGYWDLGRLQGLILSATTANYGEQGSPFLELKTKVVRETGMGGSGMYMEEKFIVTLAKAFNDEGPFEFRESIPTQYCKLTNVGP
jgi:hypothetical protein